MKSELIIKLVEMLINSWSLESEPDYNTKTPDESETPERYPIWKKVLLRWYDCGVLFWTLVSVTKWVYRMKDMRRLWYWKSKSGITLEDVANYGITDWSKITSTISLCDITDSRVSLLIPCSKEATKSIESAPEYTP